MAGYGIPHEEIATLFEVDADTLKKHCKRELETGAIKVHTQMGQLMVTTILARQPPGEDAVPIIYDDRVRADLLKFYMARRMGWKETSINELRGDKDNPVEFRLQDDENRAWIGAQLDRLEKAEAVARQVAGKPANGEDKPA
jgi:hypothetical protein